jgi:hypothetical protein
MTRLRIALVLMISILTVAAQSADAAGKQRTMTISETEDGDGVIVAMSESLARSLLEGVVGADLECGADLDDDFAGLLRELHRGGRGSKATLRDDDSVIRARRTGSSLKMKIDDLDDGARIEVKMPWAVAECLLDGRATLSADDAARIKVKVTGSDGGSFTFAVD